MKIYHNIYIAFLVLIFSLTIFLYTLYDYGLSKVSNDNTLKEIVIEKGSINSIAITLYNHNIIRSKMAFNIYVRISGKTNLIAATYNLSENMGTKKIVDILSGGNGNSTSETNITFKEGINIRTFASVVEKNTNNTEEDVYDLLNDSNYLDSIISKYWFLTDTIKNDNIYYSLEGYLYPNTYTLTSKNASIEEIIDKMLSETDKQLTKYKTQINKSTLSVHEIITLASIVELEGTTIEDRKKIAGVFYNRLSANMNLGSDVTTYYGAKVNIGERDLYSDEVTACNNYNTRCSTFKKLPISPICNPSIESIRAVLEPTTNNYYYFVADKNKNIYFSQTSVEHNNTIQKLKNEGLWYEY